MKKKLMYVIVSSIIALFILGTSFSIYTYNKIGGKQGQVVLGNIYMSANEKSITLNEIRPMDINEGLTNGSKYQFSVEGYNTSSKNIYYGVYINYGDEISTKSRFKDEDIMMYLTETKNGETREVYGPGSLKDFNDKLIYASTIDAAIKKEEKVDIDYELTVWLSDKILISDTVQEYEGKNIYTTEEYENSYASISVKVEGDFEEKNIQTGEESIAATLVSSQTEYDLSESIETREDIKIVIASSKKQPIKLTITNLDTSIKEEITNFSLVDGKYIYERLENQKARYSYSFEYSDGMISQTYYYNVNIVKDEYVSKPSSSLCKNIVYNGNQQQLTTITENKSYKLTNYNQTNAGSYVVTAILNEGYKWDDKTGDNVDFTCSISQVTLTPMVTASNKTYDKNTSATCTVTLAGAVNSENPTATASGTFADVNVGTGKTVTCSSITLGDTWKTNYKLGATSKTTTANITAKALTPSISSCTNKTYNGTTGVTCSLSVATVISGDTVTASGTCNAADKNVGTGKKVTCSSIALAGTSASNYKLSSTSAEKTSAVNITAKALTWSTKPTVSNKTYDGTTTATISNHGAISGVISGDTATLVTSGAKATFNNANIGTGKTITFTGYTLTGTDAGNYSLAQPTGVTATISQKAVTITLSATSGTVVEGKTMTFTAKSDQAGSLAISSSATSVATVSPTSVSSLAANTNQTITITGVASGSSTITVTATPTSSNYKAASKTYTATIAKPVTIPTASSHCQTGLVYNANSQTLTKPAGTGYTFSNNTRTNAGSQTVTATLSSGYRWSDNATGTKTFSCSIAKATPTITLSATSGTVVAGKTMTFTEKANVAGSFSNASGTTSVATISPASYSGIAANTAKTVTITGVAAGSSTITVNFTPTDTTNYNNATAKTYTATIAKSATIPTAANYCQTGLVYNANSQTLTKTAGTGYTFSNNTRTNAGSQTVTATLSSGYRWSDNATGTKTFSCSIAKATPTITLSATSGSVYAGATTTFTEKANVAGSFSNTSGTTSVATISPANYSSIAANTAKTVTITGVAAGSSTITVNFTPTDTTNYNNATAKTYKATVSLVGYTVKHSQMNNDGSTYTTVETVTGTGKVGSTITPAVKTYPDFTSPSQKTFTLTANPSSNVFEYKYTRNCYGTTCDYCAKGSKIGTCLYNNASKLGLWNSGLSTDTTHNNLRYTGTKSSEPKNYICIGSTTDCTGYHLHRIIGVFETAHRIKVIYPTSMGNNYYYNAGYSKITYAFTSKTGAIRNKVQGLLTNANLGYDTYITGTTKWSDMMETVTKYNELSNAMWKKTSSVWLEKYYAGEQTYSDKVYLTSAADMLLSTGSTSLTFQNNYDTIKNSWLHANKKEWIADIWSTNHSYFLGGNEGGGTQNGKLCANSTSGVTNATNCGGEKYTGYFTSSSSTTSDGAYYYRHGYRPNFEMISTTLFCGGSGTSSDPYKVGSGSC